MDNYIRINVLLSALGKKAMLFMTFQILRRRVSSCARATGVGTGVTGVFKSDRLLIFVKKLLFVVESLLPVPRLSRVLDEALLHCDDLF